MDMIAAISKNNQIGADNKLPWHIPEDLRYFKEITLGHTLIMGRKTFESIGKPLPNRTNVILTRDRNFKAEGVFVVYSLEEALDFCKKQEAQGKKVFVAGGGEIYSLFLPFVDKLYLTLVDKEIEGDTNFPNYEKDFKLIKTTYPKEAAPDGATYRFTIWHRKEGIA